MLRQSLSVIGLLMVLAGGAIAAEPSREDEAAVRASGRIKAAVSQCRKPRDVNPALPRCILTSLPEFIDEVVDLVAIEPDGRCWSEKPDCKPPVVFLYEPIAQHTPPMDDREGTPPSVGSGLQSLVLN